MAVSVVVPRLGDGPGHSVLAAWYHADGATVCRGDAVCVVETDHAAVDIEADDDGVLRYRRDAGSELDGGETVAYILAPGEHLPRPDSPAGARTRLALVGEPPLAAEAEEESAAAVWSARLDEAEAEQFEAGDAEEVGPPLPRTRALAPQATSRRSRTPAWLEETDVAIDDPFVLDADEAPANVDPAADEAAPGAPPIPWFDDESRAPDEYPATRRTRLALAAVEATEAALDRSSSADHEPPAHDDPGAAEFGPVEALETARRVLRVEVDLVEVNRMCAQLRAEWLDAGIEPSLDDVVLRAAARALRVHPTLSALPESVSLDVLDDHGPRPVDDVADAPFRVAAERRRDAEPSPHAAAATCAVTSLAPFAVDDSIPEVAPGQALALSVGAPRRARSEERREDARSAVTLTLAWDAALVSEGVAARYLGRVRALIESPYALLAG